MLSFGILDNAAEFQAALRADCVPGSAALKHVLMVVNLSSLLKEKLNIVTIQVEKWSKTY